MNGLDTIINELRGMREDLADLDEKLEQSEKLRIAMAQIEDVYKRYPRVVRNYGTGKVQLHVGDKRVL